jgi:cytochrome c6
MQVFQNFQFFRFFLLFFISSNNLTNSKEFSSYFSSLEKGEKLFSLHCISCHANGNNSILPEKNLKKETLEALGINNKSSLIYQIMNGKNGMPAFGGRLKEVEIEQISLYIFKE